MSVRPIVMIPSGGSGASEILRPSSWVPLVEPRSRTIARSPSHRISTWRRLVPASAIVMSASLPRPITVRPLVRGCRLPSTSTTPRHATWPAAVCDTMRRVPVGSCSSAAIAIETGPANEKPCACACFCTRARSSSSRVVPSEPMRSASAGARRTSNAFGARMRSRLTTAALASSSVRSAAAISTGWMPLRKDFANAPLTARSRPFSKLSSSPTGLLWLAGRCVHASWPA